MTELRKSMIESLQLRGLSERTQEACTRAVRQLAEHYHKSPDLISEEVTFTLPAVSASTKKNQPHWLAGSTCYSRSM
jgi:Phage integrase, N-terminal SAM-like domain